MYKAVVLSLVSLALTNGSLAPRACAEAIVEEPIYEVTIGQAHQGSLKFDTLLLDSYGRPSDPQREFYLAARKILTTSVNTSPWDPRIVQAAQEQELPLISGPMLGNLTSSGVTVWVRPARLDSLNVQVRPRGGEERVFTAAADRPGAATRIDLTGLPPDTPHEYRILSGSGRELGNGAFRTAPAPDAAETVRIGFGSCFHKIGVQNPNLMRRVAERGNHAVLLLGDLAVDDRDADLNLHQADYLLRDASKAWRAFSASIPIYASWDDHDYLNNDKSGLQEGQIDDAQRDALRKLWEENWANPPTTVEGRGIYFNTVIGGVEVIMLDTRSCRRWDLRNQRGSYLGDAQKQWLLRTLKASTAKFIVLTSGTMWSDCMSKGKDSWGTWDTQEREELFGFIEANGIGGVVLLSGDRHGARGFRIERPSGFTFYEFEAATLGGVPGPEAFAPDASTQIFGYAAGLKAFGELEFNLGKPDPELTFCLVDEQGEELEKHTLTRSQMTPK
ncbi:Alkaline phosphatase D precursor [Posidoniimonas polymericola]|uniref:Alkaline phosphatase D n=1 Tax=Posidoniimonas polymericola TaxID=2528002 RepID=A0A5C5XWG6_9BACT|nr:alkaline phosphatase D family protein [Posidoniimonas polymericola]TWT66335.1 Alkaline phosphatase D precursor [Posidoniimonas polymericola]